MSLVMMWLRNQAWFPADPVMQLVLLFEGDPYLICWGFDCCLSFFD